MSSYTKKTTPSLRQAYKAKNVRPSTQLEVYVTPHSEYGVSEETDIRVQQGRDNLREAWSAVYQIIDASGIVIIEPRMRTNTERHWKVKATKADVERLADSPAVAMISLHSFRY